MVARWAPPFLWHSPSASSQLKVGDLDNLTHFSRPAFSQMSLELDKSYNWPFKTEHSPESSWTGNAKKNVDIDKMWKLKWIWVIVFFHLLVERWQSHPHSESFEWQKIGSCWIKSWPLCRWISRVGSSWRPVVRRSPFQQLQQVDVRRLSHDKVATCSRIRFPGMLKSNPNL